MYYQDEIRQVDEFRTDTSLVKDKELAMAKMLISSLEAEFEPQKYHDQYRDNLQKMIEDKIEGKKVVAAPTEHVAPVIDIMEALKKSLAEKRKPAQAATAAAAHDEEEAVADIEQAPKKRARKSKAARLSCASRPAARISALQQHLRIQRAFGRLFVLEHQVQIAAGRQQFSGPRGEGIDVRLRVVRLAQPVVDEIRGEHLRHFQPLRFGDAQRDVSLAQRVVHLLHQPRRVTEFERIAHALREQVEIARQ